MIEEPTRPLWQSKQLTRSSAKKRNNRKTPKNPPPQPHRPLWPGPETTRRRLAAALLKIYQEDPTLHPELEKWCKHNFHLLRYKKGLSDRLIRIRREIYRKFVSDLAKKCSICGIEDFDLRQVTTKDQAHELVKWQRTAAGISSLRLMLSKRLTAQKLSAENTTQKCHNCGSIEKWDATHDVWHRCKQCNSRWDQDHNSVRNLLDLLCESHSDGKDGSTDGQASRKESKSFFENQQPTLEPAKRLHFFDGKDHNTSTYQYSLVNFRTDEKYVKTCVAKRVFEKLPSFLKER